MKKALLFVALWLGLVAHADAGPRHGIYTVGSGASGGSLLNVPVVQSSPAMFANGFQNGDFTGFLTANWGLLSDTGFPNGSTLAANYAVPPILPASTTSETFVVDWVGAMPVNSLVMGGAALVSTCASQAGGTSCATNCISSGGAGSGNVIFGKAGANGTNCRVELTFAIAPTGAVSSPNTFFQSGTAPNLTSLRIFRKKDEINGVLPTWNPDFIASLGPSGTNSRIMRSMGNVINSGTETVLTNPSYALRRPIGAISYGAKSFPYTQIGVGTVTLTGNNWLASGSYPGQPVNWTDKEVFQGNFQSSGTSFTVTNVAGSIGGTSGLVRLTVADTNSLSTGQVICYTGYNGTFSSGYGLWTITVVDATHVDLATSYPAGNASVYSTYSSTPGFFTAMTVQLGVRTPKALIGPGAIPMGGSGINVLAAGIITCMYDGQLDAVICSPGGLYAGLSPDLSVSLANATNTDLWLNVSSFISDTSVASIAQMVSANLNPALNVYLEYSNETGWNSQFYQYFLNSKKADAVGITTTPTAASNSSGMSWVGLRSAQIFKIFAANWSGDPTRVKGALSVQYAPGANGNGAIANEFDGVNLDPTSKPLLCAYLGGTFSGTCSGATNYSASPNRPIDVTRVVSPAPYAGNKWSDGQYGQNIISGAANNGSGLIRLTLADTSRLTTGLVMTVQGVRGTIEANATWTITKITSGKPGTVDLQGSTFVNAYTGGGIMGNANYPFNLAVTYQSSPSIALAGLTSIAIDAPTPASGYQGNTSMSEWNTTLTTYDASRPSGYGPLEIVCYEGGPDFWAAAIADYTLMGLTSSGTVTFNVGSSPAVNQTGHPYINGSKVSFSGGSGFTGITSGQEYFVMNATTNSYDVSLTYYNQTPVVVGGTPTGTTTATGSTTSIDNLYEAWKNSSAASSWVVSYVAYYKTFSHFKYVGFLQMVGLNWSLTLAPFGNNNRWSVYKNSPIPPATPYQFVQGMQQLNWLLKRDLDPASNDNAPMWLEKAA